MKLLMICYYFPPVADIGSRRSVSFAGYFQRFGWTPLVLSVSNPDPAYCTVGAESPPDGVRTVYAPSLVNIYRLFGRLNGALTRVLGRLGLAPKRNYFYDLFCIPDLFFGWIPLASLKGRALIKQERPELIYVSCSPFSAALVGVLLKKLSGLPLVVDFRDPFALEAITALGVPRWRQRLNRAIEGAILRHADRLVVTTEETRALYAEQYPAQRGKIVTIHNGFEPTGVTPGVARAEKFTIIYAGQFYDYDPRNARYTHDFFAALRLLKERCQVSAEDFQFVYYGGLHGAIAALARQHGVEDLVPANGPASHPLVLEAVSRAHLQLLRIVKPMISTKLFEGLAMDLPFLATIPEGEVADLVRRYSPGSYLITDSSAETIADAIVDARQKYAAGRMPGNHTREFLQTFSRQSLALKMMQLMGAVAGPPDAGLAGCSSESRAQPGATP